MTVLRYKAFISYSHTDSKHAAWLHRAIETYRIPSRLVTSASQRSAAIGKVFRDVDELGSATSLTAVIEDALDASESLVVICSPAAVNSQWVTDEIVYFKSRYPNRPVLPLIVAGDILPSMPAALRHSVSPDGTINSEIVEPLAASIREGKRNALTRIVSGILGLSFDDLHRRDLLRRQKRLLVVTTSSLLVASVAIGIALYALQQRNRAERETAVATQVTEFLIDLFEASDPYEEAQGDLTAREILERGVENLDLGLKNEPEVQARLLATIGMVHTNLGSFDEAKIFLDRALDLQRSISTREDRQVLRIQTARAWLAGQTDQLKHALTIYEEILPKLAEGERYTDVLPLEADWMTAVNDLGVLQWTMGDYTSAKFTLKQAISMGEAVYGKESVEIASTLNNLALVYAYSSEHESARLLYQRALSIDEKAYGKDHPRLLSVIGNFAATARSLGDWDQALLLLERGLGIAEASFDSRHNIFAFLNNGLGIVLYRQGKYDEALERLEYAGAIYVEQYGPNGSGVVTNLQHQARVYFKKGDLAKSKQVYEQAGMANGGEYGAGIANELAEVLDQLGEVEAANDLYQLAIKKISESFPSSHPIVEKYVKRYEDFQERNNL